MTAGGSSGGNFHKDMFNRWTPTHTDTNIPRLFMDGQNEGISGNSDFYLTNASYFSLRNITLGYTIPKSITSKWGLEKLRVSLIADNVWNSTKRKGLAPSQSYDGSTGYIYSPLSTYSIGLNVTF